MTRNSIWLLLLTSVAASAQPDMVPADLLYAIHSGAGPGTVTIGEAPADLVALFPEGAQVVGAFGWSGPADDDGATAIGRIDADPEALSQAYALDPPAGWQVHAWAGQMDRGGFLSTSTGRDVVLCPKASGMETPVRIDVRPRPTGGAYILAVSGGWYRVRCDGTVAETPHGFPSGPPPQVALSDLPDLQPPPQARVRPRGGGGSGDSVEQEATLTWGGSAGAALAHYGEQLEAAGWAPLAFGDRDGAASATWTAASDEGPRTVTLTAVRTAPNTYALRLVLASHGE